MAVKRKYQDLSSSVKVRDEEEERLRVIDTTRQNEFEVDLEAEVNHKLENVSISIKVIDTLVHMN